MAVTSPTPCDGCTALSPTLKSGAGTSGRGGMAMPGGGPGRCDGRMAWTGAGGGVEGTSGRPVGTGGAGGTGRCGVGGDSSAAVFTGRLPLAFTEPAFTGLA